MGKILEFPTKAVRDWAVVEQVIRHILDQTQVDSKAKTTILERFKKFFDACNRGFDIQVKLDLPASSSPEEYDAVAEGVGRAIRDHEKQLHDFVNELLLERLQLEITRYCESPAK